MRAASDAVCPKGSTQDLTSKGVSPNQGCLLHSNEEVLGRHSGQELIDFRFGSTVRGEPFADSGYDAIKISPVFRSEPSVIDFR